MSNLTNSRTKNQYKKNKLYIGFINQNPDGSFSRPYLVREVPERASDTWHIIRSYYSNKAERVSYRRGFSHRYLVLFRTKKGGARLDNIAAVLGSWLELDGREGGPVYSRADIYKRCRELRLSEPSIIIESSPGRFHVFWIYERPLEWTAKNARWWRAQQRRLAQGFADFGPDLPAMLNPVQALRNPSKENGVNVKRDFQVIVEGRFYKTNLGRITWGLNRAGIPNERTPAAVILRRFLRANKEWTGTYAELAALLGLSKITVKRLIPAAIREGLLRLVNRSGNNRHGGVVSSYESLIYIEPLEQFSRVSSLVKENKSFLGVGVLAAFQAGVVGEGSRNRALFASALYLRHVRGREREQVEAGLREGAALCGLREGEFLRTVRSAFRPGYTRPMCRSKLREWCGDFVIPVLQSKPLNTTERARGFDFEGASSGLFSNSGIRI